MGIFLVAIGATCVGCQSLMFLSRSEDLKPVAAECDKLRGQRVAVVAWAEPSTLDVDPFACVRTVEQVLYSFDQNQGRPELDGARFVSASRVNDVQEQVGANGPLMPNSEFAQKVEADIVVRIDLYEYTTRAPEADGLIKGRISGNVAVQRATQVEPLYETEVSAEYPDRSTIGVMDQTDEDVLNATLRRFAQQVAQKFFAHEVSYERRESR